MFCVDNDLSAERKALYESYYNWTFQSTELPDNMPSESFSNQTVTPPVTLEPLNLTADLLDSAPEYRIYHEPNEHPTLCRAGPCLGCLQPLPTDGKTKLLLHD